MTYNTPNYSEQGGANWVIGSGGTLTIAADANVVIGSETFTGAEVAAAIKAISGLPTEDPGDSETIWNDNGVLKVASAG